MADETAPWETVDYEGFEIHVAPLQKNAPGETNEFNAPPNTANPAKNRYTYVGYVCHPGADPSIPGHAVSFHADGEESFASRDDALYEGVHVGRSIVEGTHPDLTVLPLVTGGV
ncbi:hypothetical protein [Paraburkholderia phenoliruptrix]|uniref:Uncharacterized protein n=1 Tax=Paraburkholderia phenoliruptrix TaxID=252970 RepID=A0A6J5ACR9_9BURK|nr:hypothetical protein [Paraburkholderia phenoliruptrix]MDR6388688.1 hypothetical protein [Paraburkholderia phenoliruptrix]CAB3660643.1 hypothetical protein LMG22037_01445 [Paraburkholderia phenoliruptrix]